MTDEELAEAKAAIEELRVRDPACDRIGNRLQSFAPGPLYFRLESAENTPAG